jgi:hypothetical protein
MNWRTGPVSVAILLVTTLLGFEAANPRAAACNERADAQPPVAGRPDGFNGAVGVFHIATRAEPTDLQAEDPLVFTVRITASGSLEHIQRPDLRRLPRFARRFRIDDLDQRDLADQKTREFDYRLRPLNAGVKEIPALPFVYFKPGMIPDYRGYQTALAPAIPLTVRPRQSVPAEQVVGATAPPRPPESVYEIAEGPGLLRREAGISFPGPLVLVLIVLAPPLFSAAWLIFWRRRHPRVLSPARQRRSRAAGHALQALRQIKPTGEPAAAQAAAILVEYLREHLAFASQEPSPVEVAAFLENWHLPAQAIARARRFFDDCQAARFAPAGALTGADWTASAVQLVEEWERCKQLASRNGARPYSVSWREPAITALLAGALCWCGSLAAGQPATENELLDSATRSFHEAVTLRGQPEEARSRFLAAAAAYAALEERGFRSAALARNAGNAYLLAGDLPHAVLEYHRGLRLQPLDRLLVAGLTHARSLVAYPASDAFARPVPDSPPVMLLRSSFRTCLASAIILYTFAWLSLTRWWTAGAGRALGLGLLASCLTAFFGLCLVFDWYKDGEESVHPLVVVADDGVLLRKGNGLSYPLRAETPLNRGVEARFSYERGGWLQIELASGEIGWVSKTSALVDHS